MPLSSFIKRRGHRPPTTIPEAIPTERVLPLSGRRVEPVQRREESHFCQTLSDVLRRRKACQFFSAFLEARLASSFFLQFLLDVREFRERSDMSNSRSLESFDSGIVSPPSSEPNDAKSSSTFALEIYQSFVAHGATMELKIFPDDVVRNLVQGICTESGDVSLECFDETVLLVEKYLEVYLPDFFCGEFYARYQLEVLASADEKLDFSTRDILSDDQLSFCFMEFLGSGGRHKELLEFCLSASAVRESLLQKDAVLIYDKYVSMQATCPLGFEPEIRCTIEERICANTDNVDPDCFHDALNVAVTFLDEVHLGEFITSSQLRKHVSELEKLTTKRLRRSGSSSSVNTCGSSEMQNTLLASSSSSKKSSKASHFLDLFNADPAHLYKRKHAKVTNIGHVDRLGRYISHVKIPLEKHRKMTSSDIGLKLKRLVVSESEERSREEASWQTAETIVNDVLLNIHSGRI